MYDFLLAANAFLWTALVLHYIRLPFAGPFHPTAYYLFFHGLIFVFRPIVVAFMQYDSLYVFYQFFPSESDKNTVLVAAMLGLAAFYFVSIRVGSAPLQFKYDRVIDIERRQLIKPFLFVAALLTPFAVASSLDSWGSRAYDLNTMVTDAATGSTINTTGNGYWSDFQLMLGPLAVLTIWLFRFRWWTFIPFAGFLILRGGTGGRWPLIMASVTVGLLWLYERRRSLPTPKELLLPVVALMMFQTIGNDRGMSIRALFIDDRSEASVATAREVGFMEGMDFANLEYFEYLVYAVPQRTGTFGYFLDNLQIFTEPIPRVLWPGKPVGAPIKLFSLFDYGTPIGMTYSLPGAGWLQLGYLGVLIWCALFGWFYGRIYNWFQRSNQSNLKTVCYLLFLPLSVQFFRDGMLIQLIKSNGWFLLPLLLILWFAKLSAVPLGDDLRLLVMRALARRGGEAIADAPLRGPRARRGATGQARRPPR